MLRLFAWVIASLIATTGAASPASTGHASRSGLHGKVMVSERGYGIVPASQAFHRTIPAPPKTPFFRGGRRGRWAASAGSPTLRPSTASPKIALYSGLDSPGMNPNSNFVGETPPDSTGAIGPSHYVEMNNSNFEVWNRADLTSAAFQQFDNFIGAPAGVPFCDPQVQWDPSAARFLFSFLYCNINDPQQAYVFGWSKNSDPTNLVANNSFINGVNDPGTGGWCAYEILTGPNLFDYQKLGHNTNYMIIAANAFSENPAGNPNPPFITSQIDWLQTPTIGDTTCFPPSSYNFTSQNPLKNGDGVSNTFTAIPVNTDSNAGDGYVLSAYDSSGSNNQPAAQQNRLAVWHIDSGGAIHQDPDLTVNAYSLPSPAPQLGSVVPLDTLSGQLTQAVGDPGLGIWTQHTVNGPAGLSVVDWYEITVSGTPALAQQGMISSPTDFVFNAAISPQANGLGAAIFYNRSSASIDPLIAGRIRHSSTALGTFEPPELILAKSATGSNGIDNDLSCNSPAGAPCRWGDYSAASPDPVQTDVVWGTNMTTQGCGCPGNVAWDDQNFAVRTVPNAVAPASVSATAGDKYAWVRWSPVQGDSHAPLTGYTIKAYSGVTLVGSTTAGTNATFVRFLGLTNGTAYTFTVTANTASVLTDSPESVHSNAVTPTHAANQIAGGSPGGRSVRPAPPQPPGTR
jgi:hypothetical protein